MSYEYLNLYSVERQLLVQLIIATLVTTMKVSKIIFLKWIKFETVSKIEIDGMEMRMSMLLLRWWMTTILMMKILKLKITLTYTSIH